MLDPLKSPEEVKYLLIALHDFIREDSRQRGQILHSVVEHKYFPALVPRGGLQEFDLES